jgi:hypothetical protein
MGVLQPIFEIPFAFDERKIINAIIRVAPSSPHILNIILTSENARRYTNLS